MTRSLEKLIDIGGLSLSAADATSDTQRLTSFGKVGHQLTKILMQKNGFYAFESALHIFPSRSGDVHVGIQDWNSPGLWIDQYQGMADGCLFFSEDIFGGQFFLAEGGVYQFDPETGQKKKMAANLEDWASAVLNDYRVLTGYPLAHEWQRLNGALAPGFRLVPKVPFVAGGSFDVKNLYPLDAATAMRVRACIAVQIRDLPDGAKIRFNINP